MSDEPNTPPPVQTPAPPAVTRRSVSDFTASMIRRYGSAEVALERIGEENLRYRQKNRKVTEELEGYKTRNPQGSVVLHGEDLTTWQKVKKALVDLKLTPDDIEKVVKERDELKTTAATTSRKMTVASASKVAGFNEEVLEELVNLKGIQLELRETENEEGEKVKVPHAKVGEGQWEPLTSFAEKNLKPYLPALRGTQTDGGDGNRGTTRVPAQRKSSEGTRDQKPKVAEQVKGMIKNRYPLPSELKNKEK